MTSPIPLAQFIQARRELEPAPDCGVSQTTGGSETDDASEVGLAADLTESFPKVLPEEAGTEPEYDEAAADRQRELEQAHARGRAEAVAEFQAWWDERAVFLQEITSTAQARLEDGILASAINLVNAVSARRISEAAVEQLVQQVKEHLQQCADAVPLITGHSELGKEVAERLEGTGIQVVSSFEGGCEEVLVKLGDTAFETMIGRWTQEIESTLQ